MEQISCVCPRFFDYHQYQERFADASDQLSVNTALYEEESVRSVSYRFRVLKQQLNFLKIFAICKAFVNSAQHLTFFTMPAHFWL